VHTDWPDGSAILGAPAMPIREFWRMAAAQTRLPEYANRLRAIEKHLESPQPHDDNPAESE
jgi:UDP-3-O-[3-hydroxymyristoyl] glucosamine N-acyltransferase